MKPEMDLHATIAGISSRVDGTMEYDDAAMVLVAVRASLCFVQCQMSCAGVLSRHEKNAR